MYAPVVLGLGGCIDYEVSWDSETVEHLVARYSIRPDELTMPEVIASERDLVRSMVSFVAAGAGGERFVTNSRIIDAIAASFEKQITIGGTCVRAALVLSTLGVPSTVHLVSIDDHVRRLLPDDVSNMCSADRDSTDPHLIVQFPEGARIRVGDLEVHAGRANRIIYVHDPPNREMHLSEELPIALNSADYFLISGFNSMQDAATLEARLSRLIEYMRSLPDGALTVYEDAGFHQPELSRLVRDRLASVVDVYCMNEDEMQGHLGRAVDFGDPETVAGALRELHAAIPAPVLVVHAAHWALAFGERAAAYRGGLEGGIVAAATRYVHGDGFTEAEYLAVRTQPAHAAGSAFASTIESLLPGTVCCVPGFDLRAETPTMIGLGDTFVGGFVAALARRGAARSIERT